MDGVRRGDHVRVCGGRQIWSGLPAHLLLAGTASERMASEAAPTVAPVSRLLPGSAMLLGPSVEFISRSISSKRMIRS